jgi:glutaredoxin
MAKDFFKAKGIDFEDFDVAADLEKRQEMLTKSGQMGVPVIVIGEDLIVGFDEAAVTHLLEN